MQRLLLTGLRTVIAVAVVCGIMAAEFRIPGLHNSTATYTLLLAILFFAVKWGRVETVVASVVASYGFLKYFEPPVGSLKATDPQSYVAVAGFLITAIVVSQTALRARSRASEALEQKRVAESLLLNILPAEVAEELRAKGIVSPKYFEDVTILFTDFVGFTLSTETLAAEELVELLNDYFTAFDQIIARYGLEKMKTIGDAYMCLSGLPVRNPAHPVDTVMAAFEMVHAVEDLARMGRGAQWKVRIGIHTGPVIAGVVGIKKFAFDIWGDTVNYSSRMETSGEANRINLSERTYSRVKDFIACEHRGKVLTKDRRELDMYFANGILPALLKGSNGASAIPPAFLRRYNTYFQKNPPAFPSFLLNSGSHDLIAMPQAHGYKA